MKFNKVIFGTAVAMSAFGLLACSDDSSSNASSGDQPSAPEYKPPVSTATSPIVFNGIKVATVQNAGVLSGSVSGAINLNPDFVETAQPYTAESFTQIEGVSFAVGKNENGKILQQDIAIDLGVVFPSQQGISFSQKTLPYSQLSGCGEFQLYVVATASMNEVGLPSTPYTSVDTVTFVRPESDCAAPVVESSSAAAPAACTQIQATPIKLSNSLGTDQYALNMETGLAENPDITIKFVNGDATIVPSPGVTVVEEDNTQAAGQLPAAPVCLENFKKSSFSVTELNQNLWVVVTTAAGKDYPMMIGKIMKESATKGYVEVTYYK